MGSLSVASDPAGAALYIDGQFAGKTPVDFKQLTPGDHRVRIVQDGYVENGRVVNIRASRPSALQVKLTRSTEAAAVAAPGQVGRPAPAPSSSGGSSKKKWIIIGAAAGGGAAVAAYALTRNGPPVAGTIGVSPTGTGMAGVTSYTFTSQGSSDPDGDSLSYTWNFGDGGNGTGQTISHTFASTGTRTVDLSITDGHDHTVSAPAATVVVGPSIAGSWAGGRDALGCGVNLSFTQNSGALTGSMIFTGACSGTIPLSAGTASPLTHPSAITWTTVAYNFSDGTTTVVLTTRFSGTTNANGGSMTGTITTSSSAASLAATTTFTK
jgi:hypothetical protein